MRGTGAVLYRGDMDQWHTERVSSHWSVYKTRWQEQCGSFYVSLAHRFPSPFNFVSWILIIPARWMNDVERSLPFIGYIPPHFFFLAQKQGCCGLFLVHIFCRANIVSNRQVWRRWFNRSIHIILCLNLIRYQALLIRFEDKSNHGGAQDKHPTNHAIGIMLPFNRGIMRLYKVGYVWQIYLRSPI